MQAGNLELELKKAINLQLSIDLVFCILNDEFSMIGFVLRLTLNKDVAKVKLAILSFLQVYLIKSLQILGSYIPYKTSSHIKDILALGGQKCRGLQKCKQLPAHTNNLYSFCLGKFQTTSHLSCNYIKVCCFQKNLKELKMPYIFLSRTNKLKNITKKYFFCQNSQLQEYQQNTIIKQ